MKLFQAIPFLSWWKWYILASFLNVYVSWSLHTHEQWVLADNIISGLVQDPTWVVFWVSTRSFMSFDAGHLICTTSIVHRVLRAEGIPCRWDETSLGSIASAFAFGNQWQGSLRALQISMSQNAGDLINTISINTAIGVSSSKRSTFSHSFVGCGFRNLERRSII